MWREQDKLLWLTIYIYISLYTHKCIYIYTHIYTHTWALTINTWSYYRYVVQNFVNFSEVIYIYITCMQVSWSVNCKPGMLGNAAWKPTIVWGCSSRCLSHVKGGFLCSALSNQDSTISIQKWGHWRGQQSSCTNCMRVFAKDWRWLSLAKVDHHRRRETWFHQQEG